MHAQKVSFKFVEFFCARFPAMDEESSYGAGDSTTCEPTSAGCAKCDTREDQVLHMPTTSRTRSIAPKA